MSCEKTLGDERWVLPCGNQRHCADTFPLESISLELFALGPRVKGVLRSALWTVCWRKTCPVTKEVLFALGDCRMIPLYPVKTSYKLVSPYCLLSAGKAGEMGTKGVPAGTQKPQAVTPDRADSTTWDLEISLSRRRRHRCGHRPHLRNNAQRPTSPEDQRLNQEPRRTHGGVHLRLAS